MVLYFTECNYSRVWYSVTIYMKIYGFNLCDLMFVVIEQVTLCYS